MVGGSIVPLSLVLAKGGNGRRWQEGFIGILQQWIIRSNPVLTILDDVLEKTEYDCDGYAYSKQQERKVG